MENPEIILNLWYVYDNLGMIYSLRARCYVATGTDEEKLAFLHSFAHRDYLIARPFPIPKRLHTTLVSEGGEKRISAISKQDADSLGETGVLFEEVFVEMEKQLPAQTKLSIGRNPLTCITPLLGDDYGGVQPEYSARLTAPPRQATSTDTQTSTPYARLAATEPQANVNGETGENSRSFLMSSGVDSFQVVVDRGDVEQGDPESTLNVLRHLLVDAETVRNFCNRLDLWFAGYDHDPRELYELQEVRAFMLRLDNEFPFWLYFINLRQDMLMIIYLCLCPYTTDKDGRCTLDPSAWGGLVERHFVAMTRLAKKHGVDEGLLEQRSKEIIDFFEQHHN